MVKFAVYILKPIPLHICSIVIDSLTRWAYLRLSDKLEDAGLF